MKLTAKVIPWSSVVGTGVMLIGDGGRVVGQLALHNVTVEGADIPENRKRIHLEMVNAVADAINAPRNGPVGVNNED